MADVVAIAQQARRVAERSRVRMALRAGWVIAPLTCLALASGAHAGTCLCMAALLLAAATVLRWHGRAGVEAVTTGLALGAIPFAAALLLRSCGIECAQPWSVTQAELMCFAAGAIAGAGVSLRVARLPHDRRRRWLASILVACLTASLGCLGLGTAGLLSTLAAVLASATLVWIPAAARPG